MNLLERMRAIPAPIFKPHLLAKVFAGTKGMTRRIIADQDCVEEHEGRLVHVHSPKCPGACDFACAMREPYGVAGARWYFREGLRSGEWQMPDGRLRTDAIYYRLDDVPAWDLDSPATWGWKRSTLPSIHMPRGLARHYAEVAEVRVERVQDITDADALLEGVEHRDTCYWAPGLDGSGEHAPDPQGTARSAFALLWDSVHGAGAWRRNDWVWVYRWNLVEDPEGL